MTDATPPIDTRRDEIDALGPWFHNLHLPDGAQTLPRPLARRLSRASSGAQIAPHLPADLTGWRVLDIGCNAGFYSFELARRGASVLGIDVDARYLARPRWARDASSASSDRVEFRADAGLRPRPPARAVRPRAVHGRASTTCATRCSALDIVCREGAPADGVPDAHDAGRRGVRADTRGPRDRRPRRRCSSRAGRRWRSSSTGFAGDPTNWWAPNHAAVEAMLRSSGLRVDARPGHEIYLCEPDPAAARRRARFTRRSSRRRAARVMAEAERSVTAGEGQTAAGRHGRLIDRNVEALLKRREQERRRPAARKRSPMRSAPSPAA